MGSNEITLYIYPNYVATVFSDVLIVSVEATTPDRYVNTDTTSLSVHHETINSYITVVSKIWDN